METNIENFNKKHGRAFCIKPFTEVASTPLGAVKLCCYSGTIDHEEEYFSKDKTIKQVFNNNAGLVQARKDLLAGKRIEACQGCWKDEQAGNKSMRIAHTERYDNIDPNFVQKIKQQDTAEVKSIDIKFGNKCNYACVMCAPDNSSLWGKEIQKSPIDSDLYQSRFNNFNSLVDYPEHKYDELVEISKSLVRVKSTGGEPMLLDGFKGYIKKLVDKGYAKDITFKTVTNGTVDCTDLLPYMNEFKEFEMDWSVDGTGEVYNYVRWPGNFDRMRRIHERLATEIINKNYSRINISMHPTIQVFNLHNIPEMIQYAKDLQIVKHVDFGYIFDEPSYLNTGVFPDKMLEDIIRENSKKVGKIETSNSFSHSYDDIVSTVRRDQKLYNRKYNKKELFDKTKRIAKWFDQTRKLNINDHISTYKELANYYK